MRTNLFLVLLLSVALCAACEEQPRQYQPVSLQRADSRAEVFSSSDIVGVRPIVSSSPQAFEVWLRLSPGATERWSQLPEGLQLLCVSPRDTIGQTHVAHDVGFGKSGYCFRLTFNGKRDFDAALQKLR